jgi:acetyl esterase/lipase
MNLLHCVVVTSLVAAPLCGQSGGSSLPFSYMLRANVPYLTSPDWPGEMDLYLRTDSRSLQPTIIWIHGGNSTTEGSGSKDAAFFTLLRYLERGWNVVNLDHRVAGVTLAPTAVRNVMCAVLGL